MNRFYTLILISLALISWLHPVEAQDASTWMPDANLRAAVRKSLGVANNENLTQAKLLDLTELKAAGRGISDLTGLEHATNLTVVRLAGNQISNISSLSGLTSVTKLRLQGNEITNITSLSGLTNLTELFLNNNQITDVAPLTNLVNLGTLRLAGNSLTNAHVLSSLTNLNSVDVSIPDPPQDGSVKADPPPPETPVDTDPPSVSISVPSGVQNGAFNATITFTETVTGFAGSDVSLTGSAASITSWSANSDNTVYTGTITPTASGTVTIGVAADVATDAANNSNTAATSQSVTVDVDRPTVTIGVPSGTQTGAFNATITFSETVSGFAQSDMSLAGSAASITGWLASSDSTVYTATITPTASGTVTIGIAANVATDAANNQNTAASSKYVTVSVDTESPGVSISVPSGVQNGAFAVTITFTETVSGFAQSDVSLTGSAASVTSWSANSDDTVYTATITPTASGTLTIGVATSVATDAANNANTAATSQSVTVDVDRPTVTIGVPSGTQTGAFNATITFSEEVSGFTQSDVGLSGSAASITAWSANSDDTVYTATITPTASGTVTVGVYANVATDAAGNNNTAATSQTVTVSVDTESPGVTVSVPSGTQNGAFNATITFTETVSGFVQSDVSLSGSAASITSWSANSDDTVYTATITPTASGTVTIGVAANVATDGADNQNTAATSQTVTVDVDKPSVTIGVPSGTQTGAFNGTITFSETVSEFVQSEVSLSGSAASITGWSANSNDTVYTATITPTASGTVTIGVAANVATDAANNQNTAATSKNVIVNIPALVPDPSIWMPDANLRTAVRSALGIASNANFSKADLSTLTTFRAVQSQISHLTGLEHATNLTSLVAFRNQISNLTPLENLTSLTEIRMGNNDISDVTPLDDLTSLTKLGLQHNNISNVTPLAGLVNLTWLRLAGNSIGDLSPLVTLVNVTDSDVDLPDPDTTAPAVSITVPSGTQTGAFDATITFTETVSDFVQSDVSLSGSAASITSWGANSDDTVYTATITPTASGTVAIGVAANVATDGANNQNTAATSKNVTVSLDTTAPGVSISVPSGKQNGAFDATITFTETVSGFVQSEVSLSGSAASITSWSANSDDTVYTATITPTASGTVTIGVAANVATDAANNQNTAATSQTVTVSVDTESPGVSISVPSGVQNGAFGVTITFTETVSGFTQSEVSLNGSAASITAWSANTANTVYTATITPTASGTVTVSVAANVATDAANNQNTAATSKTVTIDVDKPTVSISVPSGVQSGAFNVSITFTEAVSDFLQSDVSLSGSAASITAWNANTATTVYTATITPTASGIVTVSVAANVATDAANNPNTASNPQTVTIDVDAPTVTIGVPSGTQTGAFNATITFSETVSEFVQSEVSLSGSAASITGWSANSDSTVYTATITPTASGTVTIGVAANVANNAEGNPNLVATPQTVSIDVDSLGVSISVNSYNTSGYGASISPVVDAIPLVMVTFTEPVKRDEFDPRSALTFSGATVTINIAAPMSGRCSEVTVDKQTIRLCSQWLYDLTVTESGELTFNIAAGVAQDLAGNSNTAATALTVTADIDRPEISRVTVPSGPQTGEFNVTIEFTEPVSPGSTTVLSGYLSASSSDLTISRRPAGLSYSATFTDERVDRTTYILTLRPDDGRWSMDGKIRIAAISSDTVKDAARNLNLQQSLSESVSPYV